MNYISDLILKEYNNILLEYNKLGRGGFGKVFEKDGFAYKITSSYKEFDLVNEILKSSNSLKSFPKFYWAKKSPKNYYIIKRELVKMLPPTEKARIANAGPHIRNYINNDKLNDVFIIDIQKKYKLSDKFINFIIQLKEDFFSLNLRHFFDFHDGNIGIDKNGNYVAFDF